VSFDAAELWGRRGHPRDRIHVELWEYHLARSI
jgi:Nitrile hydratase beta subunit